MLSSFKIDQVLFLNFMLLLKHQIEINKQLSLCERKPLKTKERKDDT